MNISRLLGATMVAGAARLALAEPMRHGTDSAPGASSCGDAPAHGRALAGLRSLGTRLQRLRADNVCPRFD